MEENFESLGIPVWSGTITPELEWEVNSWANIPMRTDTLWLPRVSRLSQVNILYLFSVLGDIFRDIWSLCSLLCVDISIVFFGESWISREKRPRFKNYALSLSPFWYCSKVQKKTIQILLMWANFSKKSFLHYIKTGTYGKE